MAGTEKQAPDKDLSAMQIEVKLPMDREKIIRHDMQHKKDIELAAMLQAHWAARVESEHRPN